MNEVPEGFRRGWTHTTPPVAADGPIDCPANGLGTWQEGVEHRLGLLDNEFQFLREGFEAKVAAGVVTGFKTLSKDEEFMRDISMSLTERLLQHSSSRASQWIGNRILTAAIIAVTGLGLTWLVKNGKI